MLFRTFSSLPLVGALILGAGSIEAGTLRNGKPAYSGPVSDAQLIHLTKVIGRDDRRSPLPVEEKANIGLGVFIDAKDKPFVIGSGLLVFNRTTVLTSAHLFSANEKWEEDVATRGALDLEKIQFLAPKCGTQHAVSRLVALTMDPERYPHKDVALVQLASPLCEQARPYVIESLNNKELGGLRVREAVYGAAYLRRSTTIKMLVGYGSLTNDNYYSFGGYRAVAVSVDTEQGQSGSPILANFDAPVVMGILHGTLNSSDTNLITMITPPLEEWIKSTIRGWEAPR